MCLTVTVRQGLSTETESSVISSQAKYRETAEVDRVTRETTKHYFETASACHMENTGKYGNSGL